MKISNKVELQETTINHSSNNDSKYFAKIYEKCTSKTYSFLVINTALHLDNFLPFLKNLIEEVQKVIKIIQYEKVKYDIKKVAARKYQHYHLVKQINMNILSDSNEIRTHNHLVRKLTLNQFG